MRDDVDVFRTKVDHVVGLVLMWYHESWSGLDGQIEERLSMFAPLSPPIHHTSRHFSKAIFLSLPLFSHFHVSRSESTHDDVSRQLPNVVFVTIVQDRSGQNLTYIRISFFIYIL